MSKMISVASGFQYSVNIGYDLNNDEKLKSFIPTKSSLDLLEDILLSTNIKSTERARILIGAYGKGKSHIILMILSMLLKKNLALFEKLLPQIKLEEYSELYQCVKNYYKSSNKILPVIINGSSTSLSQAFIMSLQRTLSENKLMDIMPATNYQAAISVIYRWQREFPETYELLESMMDMPATEVMARLAEYDIDIYKQFEYIYPSLTSGSIFNPFLGFDVIELYESVAKALKNKGYSGIYIVYDEFSKYLEANIAGTSLSETKMLQDFAEKCNRSGELQLHLMLISHKEIANYIDKLPKEKVDGWRGVSERFSHVRLNNNFSQTYEIISAVIQKDGFLWDEFCKQHKAEFQNIIEKYATHPVFKRDSSEIATAVYGCYPLHPVSTFILPRLSELIAQNERTLFTFLSAIGKSTLPTYLEQYNDDCVDFITPDIIYDYFDPLLKKEIYIGGIHDTYVLSAAVLANLLETSLEAKIIKTIALIYMLAQFERLKPTRDEIIGIFSSSYKTEEITAAIDNLIENELVIYLKKSNGFLKIKQTSGVDIWQKIRDYQESHINQIVVKDTLNKANFDNYIYPSRYNDEREMTRFFSFVFISEDEVRLDTNWHIKSDKINADGVIFAVIPNDEESIPDLKRVLLAGSIDCNRQIFILPKHYVEITSIIQEYEAVSNLRDMAEDTPILYDEYDVIYEDLRDVIRNFIAIYTQPEKNKAVYICQGKQDNIRRKADLTERMSEICYTLFADTPIINNEAVNRNEITSIAQKSRNKIVAALLRNQLESNLGFTGSGQEVSIMRSTLIRTGILDETSGMPRINIQPDDIRIRNMLSYIVEFVLEARSKNKVNFRWIYDKLSLPETKIGLRKGLIPIYLAVVLHEYKQQVVIWDRYGQVPVSADVLLQIDANPDEFTLSYIEWDTEKEAYVNCLTEIFEQFVIVAEQEMNTYDYVVNAMKRWFMSLPKYVKECTVYPNGKRIQGEYIALIKLLRQNISSVDLLFIKLPKTFGYGENVSIQLADDIKAAKYCFDSIMDNLKQDLIATTKNLFMLPKNLEQADRMSLTSTIRDWCDTIDSDAFEYIFSDGTDKCLDLFKNISNDEESFIIALARLATGLRIEDWGSSIKDIFVSKLSQYKKNAEEHHKQSVKISTGNSNLYQVVFVDDDGNSVSKSFERIQFSRLGKLLYNQITQSLDAMGQAISESEKRQILMDVLQKLC